MPSARRIRDHERDIVLRVVVESFREDPQVRWYFPADETYDSAATVFFGLLLDTRMAGGEVWVTDELDAVSMWIPPGGNLLGPEQVAARYGDLVAALPDPAPVRIAATDEIVDALLPPEAHWYLGVLACRPDRRGQGRGLAVAAPVLAAADRAGLPVALETSTPVNVRYYTRRGFAVAGCRSLGGPEDPMVWVMRREPLLTPLT